MKKSILTLPLALLVAGYLFGQARTLTGKVTDQAGQPLPGATVLVKDAGIGTTSDVQGTYTIVAPNEYGYLVFSFIGFETEEVEIRNQTVIDIQLKEATSALDEVIVVGFGKQIKSKLTGNIAKVGGDEIQNLPVNSVEQALQGRAAGVFVESVNGKVGGAIRVRIRGISSISAGNQPLYVIDGIPVTTESQNNRTGAPLNPLADLNFNDIETVEILKDASAGAIYGSRASAGVVLITTKQGKAGKTKIELNLQSGFSNPTGRREFLNADEFIQMYTRSAVGAAKYEYKLDPSAWGSEQEAIDWYVGFMEARFDRYSGWADWRTREVDTDWQDYAFRTGLQKMGSLSASGGNDKTKYFASAAWSDQEGILVGNGFERMSGRLNLDQKASDKINFGVSMNVSRTRTEQLSNDDAFSTPLQLIAQLPITPPRDENGEFYDRPVTSYYNGLIELEEAKRDVISLRTLANGYVRYEILDGLKLNGELGTDLYTLRDNAFFGRKTFDGQASDGAAHSLYSQVSNWNSRLFLNYDTYFKADHHVDFVTGMEFQKSRTDFTFVQGEKFPVDDLTTLASAASITNGTSSIEEFSFLSYFGRLNYDFRNKYLLTLSGRMDGSSRFGQNDQFGFFPAASVGWVLTEEGFLKENGLLSFLKLRASYGKTGNAAIGNYAHLGLFNGRSYNEQSGLAPQQIPNPDLQWEKTTQTDLGIDFGFWDNRLNGEIDVYLKKTKDLLLDVPVPGTSGFSVQTRNAGEVENKGIEFVLNSNNLTGKFQWTTSLNFARNKNKVVALAEEQDLTNVTTVAMNVVKVGHPVGAFYGAEYAGVDPANGDALFYLNKEGQERETTSDYTQSEYIVLGSPHPDFIGGITNSFSWKGISLDVTFQGVYGNEIQNGSGNYMSCQACWFDNQTKDQLDYWDKPGDVTDVPEPRFWYTNGDQRRSSRYLSDGSYLRLKTLTLAWELPRPWLERVRFSRLRIYATAQNLLTFTKYDGWDPEVTADIYASNVNSGMDFYAAPQPKTMVFGVTVGF